MLSNIDFDKINSAALGRFEDLLFRWFPNGQKQGPEFKIGSLSGERGDSLSINLRKGVWTDFAGTIGGSDPISLVAALHGLSQGKAAKLLNDELGAGGVMGTHAAPQAPKAARPSEWKPIAPAPADAPKPPLQDFHYGEPEAVWTYKNASGETIGFIRRFKKTASEGKEIKPLVWATNGTRQEWRPMQFAEPRPLYGLELLAALPNEGVMIVEGEKTADAARTIIPGIVVTWPGGSKATKKVDWTALKGRKVLIWPDEDHKTYDEKNAPTPDLIGMELPAEDQPGMKAALAIQAALAGVAASVRIITPPGGNKDGWDLADAVAEGWDKARAVAHIKARLAEAPTVAPEPPVEAKPKAAPKHKVEAPDPDSKAWPFRILGHDRGDYYYLPKLSKQVVRLTARAHVKNEFLALAPLQWWEEMFPGKDGEGSGVSWLAAANALMQQALPREFDPDAIRGRGAWLDDDGVVFHAGDRLLIDGEHEADIESARGRFIYERGRRLNVEIGSPASNGEANKLRTLCKMLSTKHIIDAEFLAGWMVLAPICGVMSWRPHLWVTGGAGTGKSTVLTGIVKPMLGKTALVFQGNSTEAGIRQTLRRDSLPIIFDEAESEEKQDIARVQNILNLMRVASSEGDGVIAKGSTSGDPNSFMIRSMFCLASIGVAASRRADRSRITLIELVKKEHTEEAAAHWKALQDLMLETVAEPGFCESIRARSLLLAPIIVKNAAIFSRVVTRYLGTQRDGDQVGALLAGAYSLTNSREITKEEADAYCAEQDWTPWKYEDQDMDEHRAFATLMQAIITHQEADKTYRFSVAELIRQALQSPSEHDVKSAMHTLERHGIAIRQRAGGGVDVSNNHNELKRIFSDTPFANKWSDQLRRLDKAEEKSTSYFNGVSSRAVRLPKSMFIKNDAYELA